MSDPVGGIPDLLRPGLALVFCGYNPSLRSGATGHNYAHPGNRFWRVLHAAGISDRLYAPDQIPSADNPGGENYHRWVRDDVGEWIQAANSSPDVEVRLRLVHLAPARRLRLRRAARVDLHEHLASLDRVAGLDGPRDHPAGHLRGQRRLAFRLDDALDPGDPLDGALRDDGLRKRGRLCVSSDGGERGDGAEQPPGERCANRQRMQCVHARDDSRLRPRAP